jgi:ribosomal-protein-alanine N-acetyltransferase
VTRQVRRTTAGVEMRAAVPNDLDAVAAIERQSFSDPWSRASFAQLIGRDHLVFFVATRKGAVAGFSIAYAAVGEAEIANIAVATAARGQGVGGALLRHLLTTLRAGGAVEVWLEVRASNAAARALYERFGFVEVGRRRNYYRRPVEDAISMRRDLLDATE